MIQGQGQGNLGPNEAGNSPKEAGRLCAGEGQGDWCRY